MGLTIEREESSTSAWEFSRKRVFMLFKEIFYQRDVGRVFGHNVFKGVNRVQNIGATVVSFWRGWGSNNVFNDIDS